MKPDGPKTLGELAERARRTSLLYRPHVAPLTRYVQRLRRHAGASSEVPYFDPLDGGTKAECLFLLEAPGGRAVESGFISRNNPDETARNFFLLNQQVGLDRRRTVTWNVVPWYVGTGKKIRAVVGDDMQAAEPNLRRLMAKLDRLKAVVLLGRKAQRAQALIQRVAPDCEIFTCPHPSPLVLNGRPHKRQEILKCLREVVIHLGRH